MFTYKQNYSTKSTPQSEQASPAQVPNSAGGFSFVVDDWKRLDRFLVLGSEGGSYYATERKLTVDNAKCVERCLDIDPLRAVNRIVEISDAGRAAKNDAAIFALAIASGHKSELARDAALSALPKVARIGTHLFQFVGAAENFRSWGPAFRKAIAAWYNEKSASKLAMQLVKYQQREGWSHRDVLRKAHVRALDDQHMALYRFATAGIEGLDAPRVRRADPSKGRKERVENAVARASLPSLIEGFLRLQKAESGNEAAALIREHGLPRECVPTKLLNEKVVWEALLDDMGQTALIRNLGKMSAIGMFGPMSELTKKVCAQLTDVEAMKRGRVHPFHILLASTVYDQGHGEKGGLSWTPERAIVDALDDAFYLAFDAIVPTGKKFLIALDVSGSMGCSMINGTHLSARDASAAMALATAKTEKDFHVIGFTGGYDSYSASYYGGRKPSSASNAVTVLNISPKDRLPATVKTVSNLPMGPTDCALPALYAMERKIDVDAILIYTDSETWCGSIHPHQALKELRQKTGKPVKQAVIGMTANEFTVADPSDSGELDVVGFDSSAPSIIADFVRE